MAPQIISPFDPTARTRLRRMGLLTVEDQVNTNAIETISTLQAGLLFSQILDSCGDWEGTLSVCRRITAQAAQIKDRQILLLISIQYDAIAKPLPEVIWWISGSDALLAPFVRSFVHHLNELCAEDNPREGGDVTAGLPGRSLLPLMDGSQESIRNASLFCFEMLSMTALQFGKDGQGNTTYSFDVNARGMVRGITTERYKSASA